MRIPLYQVDAFTSRLFGGNPAAVCPLAEWLRDATMQAIAAENNLAETAFFVAQGGGYLLRWFTPTKNRVSGSDAAYAVRAVRYRSSSRHSER